MMNETLKTIYARRSVRAYKPEQITDDELETVLKAGEYAPSANNQQSQLFVAIQKKALLDELAAVSYTHLDVYKRQRIFSVQNLPKRLPL